MRIFAAALLTLGKGIQGFSPRTTSSRNINYNNLHRTYARTTTSLNMSSKRVLVPIADGSEEIETTCKDSKRQECTMEPQETCIEATETCETKVEILEVER